MLFNLFFWAAVYLYVIGGVVAGRAEWAKFRDRTMAISAAFVWPVVPSKWLFNFVRNLLD